VKKGKIKELIKIKSDKKEKIRKEPIKKESDKGEKVKKEILK